MNSSFSTQPKLAGEKPWLSEQCGCWTRACCSLEAIKSSAVFLFPNIVTTCSGLFPPPPHGHCGFFGQMKAASKGKTSGSGLKTDASDRRLFQRQLGDRTRLFEEEKEMEGVVANQVKQIGFIVSLPHRSHTLIVLLTDNVSHRYRTKHASTLCLCFVIDY